MSAAGTAVTLALPGADASAMLDALDQLQVGDMVLVDRLGDMLHACIGGLIARALRDIGVAGVVVDGPVVDRYSERKESAEAASKRVKLSSI